MATATIFEVFAEHLGEEVHKFDSDTIKLGLSNTAPTASTDDQWADITEISTGNGYSAGGMSLSSVTWTRSGGVATLDAADETLTASGGAISAFRYVILYNDSAAGDELICYWDLGASQTIADGNSRVFSFDSQGILTIDVS